jgi:ABC-2 type transport system permease protein
VNWIGIHTLYLREVRRFWKVLMQTLVAPVVTTLLYLAIFALAFHHQNEDVVPGVSFNHFLVPGLIMMALAQNAFANSSSSLIIGKVNSSIVDILLPPLSPFGLTAGLAAGAMTRGLLVAVAVAVGMWVFVPFTIAHPLWALYYSVAGGMMLGLLGIFTGIWAEKFDHVATITNFIVTPLSFLSGTFYAISRLPEAWQVLAHINPFFYMIDGMRYAFTGYHDGPVVTGALVLLGVNIGLWLLCQRLFHTGYKLRS